MAIFLIFNLVNIVLCRTVCVGGRQSEDNNRATAACYRYSYFVLQQCLFITHKFATAVDNVMAVIAPPLLVLQQPPG